MSELIDIFKRLDSKAQKSLIEFARGLFMEQIFWGEYYNEESSSC